MGAMSWKSDGDDDRVADHVRQCEIDIQRTGSIERSAHR
jgi:hypothetical protein